MESIIEVPSSFESQSCLFRRPGVDFDQEGRKSTLMELCQMEGLFPLAKVTDRLPFQESELLKFARKGPFVPCFEKVRSDRDGRVMDLLVNITRFVESVEQFANRPYGKA
jgi:hypothetical protein